MKRVLLISYVFPPVGGAGVQRAVKFSKYLPRHGWEVSVLTASNPSVPLFDSSLQNDVPSDTVIERARTLEPSYAAKASVAVNSSHRDRWGFRKFIKSVARSTASTLLQPDPQILWAPQAMKRASQLLKSMRHDAIIATAPPFSSLIIGKRLSQKFGLPLVVDYRDEWEISNAYWENRRPQGFITYWQRRQQAAVLRRASAILATTKSSADSISRIARASGSQASAHAIYNGYDPDDFHDAISKASHRRVGEDVRLTYTGTLWQLTTIGPLVSAIEIVSQREPLLASRLTVTICGRRTSDQDVLINRLRQTNCRLDLRDYAPHAEMASLLCSSDCLCLLLAESSDAGRVVPAKTFEYIAARRPILAIAPKGEVWDILESHPAACLYEPQDVEGIAEGLEATLKRVGGGQDQPLSISAYPQYSRDAQARQLGELLDRVIRKRDA